MPAPLPVTLTGTVSADTRFRDIPGGGGLAYFTLATEMTSPSAPGAPAITRTVHIECAAARGTIADAMFDQLKRGTRVTVQGRPILTPPPASGPRLRQLNTLYVEPLPQA